MRGGDDDDEPQRPETDFAKFAYPSTKKSENEPGRAGANRPADLRGAVEAIMLVLDEPVAEDVLAGVLDVTTAEVAEELTALAADYNETGAASSCAGRPVGGGSTRVGSSPRTWSGSCSTASRCG